MATHVALESVHHLHRVHDVVAGGWAHTCDVGRSLAPLAASATALLAVPGRLHTIVRVQGLRGCVSTVLSAASLAASLKRVLHPSRRTCCGLLCCICCWWELANAGAESALLARGAEQAVELSAPRPAG